MTNQCLPVSTLEQYLLRTLPPWRIAAVEEHLLACADCAKRAEELQEFIEALRKASDPPPDPPPSSQ